MRPASVAVPVAPSGPQRSVQVGSGNVSQKRPLQVVFSGFSLFSVVLMVFDNDF